MDYASMTLAQVSKLDGVADLPLKVRGNFAQALQAEARGDHARANELLVKAVNAESA